MSGEKPNVGDWMPFEKACDLLGCARTVEMICAMVRDRQFPQTTHVRLITLEGVVTGVQWRYDSDPPTDPAP